jgi:hypothetical protein
MDQYLRFIWGICHIIPWDFRDIYWKLKNYNGKNIISYLTESILKSMAIAS